MMRKPDSPYRTHQLANVPATIDMYSHNCCNLKILVALYDSYEAFWMTQQERILASSI